MMVYRSIVVGLLAAIAAMLAARVTVPRVTVAEPAPAAVEPAAPPGATLVDVSRTTAGADPVPLLGLHPGERVVEIDGVTADAVDLIGRWEQVAPGDYVDLTVASCQGSRRILLLVHP